MSLPRYPEYKDSGVEWLGEVPRQWHVAPLKRSFRLITERATAKRRAIALENIEGWSGRYIETEGEFQGDGTSFEPGDLLFGKLRPYLAKVLLADFPGEAVGDFHVLRPHRHLCPRFAHYQVLQREFISVVDGSTFGSKMPRAGWESLGGMPFVVPALSEQKQIAAFLDRETARIDALIAEQEKLLALLAEKRQATISHAVTRGLDPNVPMKDSGIAWLGEVPAHWAVSRFKASIASAKNGVWGGDAMGDANDIPCVRVADFDRRELTAGKDVPTLRNVTESERQGRLLKNGDLLLEKSGGGESQPVGQVVLYVGEAPAVCSNFVARVELMPGMDSRYWRFVHAAAYASRINVRSIKQTSGIQNLDQGQYFDEPAPFPPPDEQVLIADFLDQRTHLFDVLEDKVRKAIQLLQERRSALISAAVTGQIDVRGLVEMEAA